MSNNLVVGNATPLVQYPNVLPTPTALPRPKLRRFEFEKNSVGANWLVANMDNWTVQDIGFGSRSWIGCKFKTCGRNHLAVHHDGTWQEISADIKRG